MVDTESLTSELGTKSLVQLRQHMETAFMSVAMQAPPAVVPVSGENFPNETLLSRAVRDKAMSSGVGKPIGDDGFEVGNYVLVIDVDRLDDIPDRLLDENSREEYLRDCDWEVYINALGGVGQESGELIRDRLVEIGECYDKDAGECRPGYHDPLTGDAVPGENKPFVVVNSS